MTPSSTRKLCRLAASALLSSNLCMSAARAAHIEIAPGPDGVQEIRLSGEIAHGDACHVAFALQNNPNARRLVLDSPGGGAIEGLRIGMVVKTAAIETRVRAGAVAASAAGFAFLAGTPRIAEGRVLLHGPYLPGGPTNARAEHALAATRLEMKVWLVHNGLGAIADRILAAPADGYVEMPAEALAQHPTHPQPDDLGMAVIVTACTVDLDPREALAKTRTLRE